MAIWVVDSIKPNEPVPVDGADKFPANSNLPKDPVDTEEPLVTAESNKILLADIVRLVPSPSIFSLAPPNWIPLSLGNTTSAVGERLIILPVIVKSVLF